MQILRPYCVIGRLLLAFPFALLRCTSAPAAVPGDLVATCEELDRTARTALQQLLEEYFPPPDTVSCGMHSNGAQVDTLTRFRDGSVPCLLALQRGDLRKTTLWRRSDPAPDVKRWSADLIGQIDPVLAIRLYSQMLGTSSTQWDRLSLRLMMVQFGDRSSLSSVVSILESLHIGKLSGERQGTALEAIYVLVRYDDRDALPLVKAAHSAFGDERRYLGTWVAQLERDVPALERDARAQGTWSFALDSLARVGARDVLERLAADPNFYGRDSAKMLLSKGLPPLRPAVNPRSICEQIDDAGHRELASWLVNRIGSRAEGASDCGTESLPLALQKQREVASACIEDIYRRGLTGTEVWPGRGPAPYPGALILSLLGVVDPTRATGFWREWRDSPGRSRWERAYADWMRVNLGDRGGVSGLVAFLRETLNTPRDAPGGAGYLLEESAAALIKVDHRPALSLLENWRQHGYLTTAGFDVGVARLARDSARLEKLARDSGQATSAIEALGFIRARDSLKRLAEDPSYKYRYWASGELERLR